jgi:hypothetical protein
MGDTQVGPHYRGEWGTDRRLMGDRFGANGGHPGWAPFYWFPSTYVLLPGIYKGH